MNKCIAIDGPSGTGKSTTAKKLSSMLGIVYVDTGAMYRAIAYQLKKSGVDLNDEAEVIAGLDGVDLQIKYIDKTQHVIVNEEDVTDAIRTEEVGNMASTIAVYKGVREKLVEMQKKIAEENDVVMDGRDIGTAVLPFARFKFYLDADAQERAKRRLFELEQKGIEKEYEELLNEIIERDERDKNREESPLVQAPDAVYIDTSNLDEEEVVLLILKTIEDK